ncbi:outer membrane protein assembly factor BamE, partial [Testudinibacter aquarius]
MKLKLVKYALPLAVAVALAGCRLSDVKSDGTTDQPVWPKVEDAGVNFSGSQYGIWPNWDNVRMIEKGMNKDQLYYLIGRPHFSEGLFAVREWDYVFNYRQNGEHKICQYKVLFDKDMNAQSFFWKPTGCNNQYELSGDFLFDFDSATLSAKGKSAIDEVARGLNESGSKALT